MFFSRFWDSPWKISYVEQSVASFTDQREYKIVPLIRASGAIDEYIICESMNLILIVSVHCTVCTFENNILHAAMFLSEATGVTVLPSQSLQLLLD